MLDIKTPAKGLVAHGLSACHGCGLELTGRVFVNTAGKNSVICIPPGCGALFSGMGNETALRIPGLQGNLGATAAYAAGIRAGFEMQGREDINVLAMAGDGATVDIGLQSLSGMLDRGEKVLYLCYDNEAYMNTGIQGSASTPSHAWTSTTPAGKQGGRKDLLQIVAAHRIPYAASASVGDVDDLRKKILRALEAIKSGPAFLHVHAPCPTGWGYDPAKTIEIARLAVESKCWL
ncbi:thiamine pyrophosphate-dependent enzyme, partial [Desulfovibrio sp. OttesenSCG-928-C06]|nr:thiamine pyrophosphate-dependent enzyme [Desulfovibrio sp. OttesenSCG-928-C06]